jgi:hypothetical protein
MTDAPLTRVARGPRPDFFSGEPAADRLLTMILALASDVAALRERVDTIERITAARGMDLAAEIDAYEPPIAVREERERWRQQFLDRLLKVFGDEVAGLPPPPTPAPPVSPE